MYLCYVWGEGAKYKGEIVKKKKSVHANFFIRVSIKLKNQKFQKHKSYGWCMH